MAGKYDSVKGGASIHFNAIRPNSESHNQRQTDMPHIHVDKIKDNEQWIGSSVQDMMKEIRRYCKEKSGRAMYKTAEPIREAVLNLAPHHTLEDVKNVAEGLKEVFGIECFQIYIHRDEGLDRDGKIKLNHHAHLVCRWQDMETGKTFKFMPSDLSQMQDYVASALNMERGNLRENTNRERLEAVEYKRQQEELRLQELRLETEMLEKKKHSLSASNAQLEKTITQRIFGRSLTITKELLTQINSYISPKLQLIEQLIALRSSFLKSKEKLIALEGTAQNKPKNRGFGM
jgi:hypothetical protein